MEAKQRERARQLRRSKLERRQIVEESLNAGASVAVVARAHGVNANQVFAWRKLYREGQLEVEGHSTALLPVQISKPVKRRRAATKSSGGTSRLGIIDIDLGHARVRIQGRADPDCVRAALEGLAR